MKKLFPIIALIIFAIIVASCTRTASGPAVTVPTQPGSGNTVSTQSALMKEIIAGTQTAMALASGGTSNTAAPGTTPGSTQTTGSKTATPSYASPTPNVNPTSNVPTLTPGPPSEVLMTYVSGAYNAALDVGGGIGVGVFEITKVVKDQNVTIQTKNFPPNIQFTVRMGLYGTYAENGIIVGFSNSGKGGVLTATYTIPDALRGQNQIHMRFDGSAPYWSANWFYNNSTQ